MRHWTSLSLFFAIALTTFAWSTGLFVELGSADSKNAAGIFAQISATMLGFLIAALSILASISGHRLLREMQKKGHYRVLLRRFFINSGAYALAMLTAFGALIFKHFHPYTILASFGTFCFATLLLVDIGWRLWLVLHNLTPEARD